MLTKYGVGCVEDVDDEQLMGRNEATDEHVVHRKGEGRVGGIQAVPGGSIVDIPVPDDLHGRVEEGKRPWVRGVVANATVNPLRRVADGENDSGLGVGAVDVRKEFGNGCVCDAIVRVKTS